MRTLKLISTASSAPQDASDTSDDRELRAILSELEDQLGQLIEPFYPSGAALAQIRHAIDQHPVDLHRAGGPHTPQLLDATVIDLGEYRQRCAGRD
ncbi:hypothetical protein [Streptomyces graminilatus]|uniref:hypothetical protein n=1 Tax=Streptomyces graminilatus TaxID=1464070 RepID=UPI0012FEA566|nr:hypothetical protein [Streptomyces graminilatus]